MAVLKKLYFSFFLHTTFSISQLLSWQHFPYTYNQMSWNKKAQALEAYPARNILRWKYMEKKNFPMKLRLCRNRQHWSFTSKSWSCMENCVLVFLKDITVSVQPRLTFFLAFWYFQTIIISKMFWMLSNHIMGGFLSFSNTLTIKIAAIT